jgi:formylglycine-generating enzyme required for sulfatase activity
VKMHAGRLRYGATALLILLALAAVISLLRSDSGAETAASIRPEMVMVPGGTFSMGVADGDDCPLREVGVDTFTMGKYEVTNAQYHAFCLATARRLPEFWGMARYHCGPEFPDHPVVGVSWSDAKAYAEWCDLRLPTEAEWEYAARGGLVGKNFAFGDDIDSTLANFKSAGTERVGRYQPNAFGLYDMTGNVVEWVADYYDASYYTQGVAVNPPGPTEGKFRVVRGGGWRSGPYCNRVYYRNALVPQWVDFNVGFRCAGSKPGLADQRAE